MLPLFIIHNVYSLLNLFYDEKIIYYLIYKMYYIKILNRIILIVRVIKILELDTYVLKA